jgi:multiple sugar transport system substrate-binding protein
MAKKLLLVILVLILSVSAVFANAAEEKTQSVSVTMPRIAVSKGYPDLVPIYEEMTGIKVELLMLPETEYEQKVMLELGSRGSSYDVLWAGVAAAQKYAGENWIEPLDPFIADPELTNVEDFDYSDFSEGLLGNFTFDSKLYALPSMNATILMYYRKDIFEKYGITRPPKTWAELEEVCSVIHTEETPAIAMRASRARYGVMWPFPMIAHSFGASFVKDYPNDMHPTVDSPEMLEAITYYKNLLVNYGYNGATTGHFSEVITALQQGKAAIMIDGAPLVGAVLDPEKSQVVGKIGFAVVPEGPAALWPPSNAHGLTIPAGSKNKNGGWEFIKWALSKETQLKNALDNNETALTRTSVVEDPKFLEKYNFDNGGYTKALSDTFANLKPYYWPLVPEWREAEDYISVALSEIITSNKNPETVLAEANKQVFDIFLRAGYYSE